MSHGSQLAERKDKSLFKVVSEVPMNLLQTFYAPGQAIVHRFVLSVT